MGLTIDEAKHIVRSGNNVTEEALVVVYESFGGLEAFTAPKLSSETKELRNFLLASPQFPVASFIKVVEGTPKFTRWDVESITRGDSPAFLSFSIFLRFWEAAPNAMMRAMNWVHINSISEVISGMGKHPFQAETHLEDAKTSQAQILTTMDSRIIEMIRDEVFGLSEDSRVCYAESCFIRDDHWRKLALDKRKILNALTYNSLLPTDVATEIALAHKTPWIRENIARYTTSPELLQIIWDSTKSKYIHASVKANQLFVPLV